MVDRVTLKARMAELNISSSERDKIIQKKNALMLKNKELMAEVSNLQKRVAFLEEQNTKLRVELQQAIFRKASQSDRHLKKEIHDSILVSKELKHEMSQLNIDISNLESKQQQNVEYLEEQHTKLQEERNKEILEAARLMGVTTPLTEPLILKENNQQLVTQISQLEYEIAAVRNMQQISVSNTAVDMSTASTEPTDAAVDISDSVVEDSLTYP